MNQVKIGKFICELRKEKKLTQEEVAKKLGVTDRAISKWENGRGMPDYSLLKPICDLFDISVNELLSGKRLSIKELKKVSDENIVNYLNKNKTVKRKYTIFIIVIILTFLLFSVFVYQDKYPKFEIYKFDINLEDDTWLYKLNKSFNFDNRNFYYYGIKNAEVCDINGKCYELLYALKHGQIDINSLNDYLKREIELNHLQSSMLWDGGTSLYSNDGISFIMCNSLDGNHDIYLGASSMIDDLNGNYCGHVNDIKVFRRSYKIISVEYNTKYNIVKLTDGKNEKIVKVNNNYKLNVGEKYLFTFYTYEDFKDTIDNVFKYSSILNIKLDDRDIFENIVVNKKSENNGYNELENVSMELEDVTSVSGKLIITDLSGNNYIYGSTYYIEKYVDNKWIKLDYKHDNIGFDAMAYGVDKQNKLVFNLNWEYMYGKLESGKYRVVKDVLPNNDEASTIDDTLFISATFTID